jgi:hypothetical protein
MTTKTTERATKHTPPLIVCPWCCEPPMIERGSAGVRVCCESRVCGVLPETEWLSGPDTASRSWNAQAGTNSLINALMDLVEQVENGDTISLEDLDLDRARAAIAKATQ